MTFRRLVVGSALCAMALVLVPPAGLGAQSDLDAFMKQVLARRDENWKKLQEFILDEREVVDVRGPGGMPVWGQRLEYSWYIQEGYFVRSPTRANGVEISEDDRRRAEARYLGRAKARAKKDAEKKAAEAAEAAGKPAAAADDPDTPPSGAPEGIDGLIDQVRQPGFVDSAYFLKFKFEQGTYAFVGREKFEDLDVLKIEYYPEQLFSDDQERERKRRAEGKPGRADTGAALERMMNKVSLVTIWVEPSSHQIVKYTFDNVNLDFLPAAWLVRLNDLRASMTMSQPFPGVWLPRDVAFTFGAMLAIGPIDVRYLISYHDYREAKTSGRIRRIGGRP